MHTELKSFCCHFNGHTFIPQKPWMYFILWQHCFLCGYSVLKKRLAL